MLTAMACLQEGERKEALTAALAIWLCLPAEPSTELEWQAERQHTAQVRIAHYGSCRHRVPSIFPCHAESGAQRPIGLLI